jgi:hypothetical protein
LRPPQGSHSRRTDCPPARCRRSREGADRRSRLDRTARPWRRRPRSPSHRGCPRRPPAPCGSRPRGAVRRATPQPAPRTTRMTSPDLPENAFRRKGRHRTGHGFVGR